MMTYLLFLTSQIKAVPNQSKTSVDLSMATVDMVVHLVCELSVNQVKSVTELNR